MTEVGNLLYLPGPLCWSSWQWFPLYRRPSSPHLKGHVQAVQGFNIHPLLPTKEIKASSILFIQVITELSGRPCTQISEARLKEYWWNYTEAIQGMWLVEQKVSNVLSTHSVKGSGERPGIYLARCEVHITKTLAPSGSLYSVGYERQARVYYTIICVRHFVNISFKFCDPHFTNM